MSVLRTLRAESSASRRAVRSFTGSRPGARPRRAMRRLRGGKALCPFPRRARAWTIRSRWSHRRFRRMVRGDPATRRPTGRKAARGLRRGVTERSAWRRCSAPESRSWRRRSAPTTGAPTVPSMPCARFPRGTPIAEEDVAILRTEKVLRPGLDPLFLSVVVGARAKRRIPDGEGIEWADIAERRRTRRISGADVFGGPGRRGLAPLAIIR